MPGKKGHMFREWKDETAKHEIKHKSHDARIRGMRQAKRKDRRIHLSIIIKDEGLKEIMTRGQIH